MGIRFIKNIANKLGWPPSDLQTLHIRQVKSQYVETPNNSYKIFSSGICYYCACYLNIIPKIEENLTSGKASFSRWIAAGGLKSLYLNYYSV